MSEPKREVISDPELAPEPKPLASGPVPKPRQPQDVDGNKPALTELDSPNFERLSGQPAAANDNAVSDVRQLGHAKARVSSSVPAENESALEHRLVALAEAEAIPDSDSAALTDATDSVLSPKPAPEPNTSTRSHTHVSSEFWFDAKLELQEADVRQRLAWRFKAAFSAWKLLLPLCAGQLRRPMVEEMRRYERLLRSSGPAPKAGDGQLSDALHLQLTESKAVELDRALGQLEGAILSVDASISQEAFRTRWNRDHVDPKQLLRYARFLGARRFGIGYRRDRFEALALDLLTARLPSGRLLLMPRRRAAQVLRQLLRGLHRPSTEGEDHKQAVGYLRDALDRLDAMAGPKQFFDSDFYLDVYGYKISRHDSLLSPEFLYLAVALEVDVHNRLSDWAQTGSAETGKPLTLAALQLQLRAQKEAAQAVFSDFHKPLVGSASTAKSEPKKPRSKASASKKPKASSSTSRLLAASLFALSALAANLYVTGAVQLTEPPRALNVSFLQSLSPLLVSGRLSADGKQLRGAVSRLSWRELSARERTQEAERLASELKRRGIEHAELLAYKARAMQIDFGSVVYVDTE